MSSETQCEHTWRAYTDDEMKELRSKTRSGRPPMAWVEGAEQCGKCGSVEASISWYGQVHRVPYARSKGVCVQPWSITSSGAPAVAPSPAGV